MASGGKGERLVRGSARLYEVFLVGLYPENYKEEYAREMRLAFGDLLREEHGRRGVRGITLAWCNELPALLSGAMSERSVAMARTISGMRRFIEERFHKEELHPGVWSFVASVLLFIVGASAGIFAAQYLWEPVYPEGDNWFFMPAMMLLTWLLFLPLAQYLLLRFVGGTRPRLAWAPLVPNVFLSFRVVGHRIHRKTFALVSAVPFFIAWVLFPLLATLMPGGWEAGAPLVGAAMGISVYFLRYSVLALSKPRGTLVEELAEEGSVRFYEPVQTEARGRTA